MLAAEYNVIAIVTEINKSTWSTGYQYDKFVAKTKKYCVLRIFGSIEYVSVYSGLHLLL